MINGPFVTIGLSCWHCHYCRNEGDVQEGVGATGVFCTHPEIGKLRIGVSNWNTPAFCPFRSEMTERLQPIQESMDRVNRGLK